jgi:hypothetical protein
MKFQTGTFYVLFLLIAIFGAACTDTTAPANNNAANTAPTNTTPANAANTVVAPSPAASASPATTNAAGSPSATVAAYQQAMFKKDEAAFRRVISEASAREISADATAEKKTLVQFWTEFSEPTQATIETRNERVSGDIAFVETKNPKTGLWSPNKLIREKGEWKMDITSAAFKELQDQIKK